MIDFIKNYISEYSEYLVISEIPTKMKYTPSKEVQQLEEDIKVEEKVAEKQVPLEPLNTDIPDDIDEVTLGVYNLLKSDKLTPDVIARNLNIPRKPSSATAFMSGILHISSASTARRCCLSALNPTLPTKFWPAGSRRGSCLLW